VTRLPAIPTAKRGLFELNSAWQQRANEQLDMEHVEHLASVLSDGGTLPALDVVALENGALAVVDGYHRFAAYVRAGLSTIPYRVVAHGADEVLYQSAAANKGNGRHRSAECKRKAIRTALSTAQGADAENTEIAKHCGVSVDLVRSVRAEVRGAPSAAAERRQIITGEHGTGGEGAPKRGRRCFGTRRNSPRRRGALPRAFGAEVARDRRALRRAGERGGSAEARPR
jgi:hypothetical protein